MRTGILVVMLLILATLIPHWRIIAGLDCPIHSAPSVSDLTDGEIPPRVEAARIARQGEFPIWTSRNLTGLPLVVDPLSIALFSLFSPPVALGLLWAILIAIGAAGAYVLSRHSGASRAGAFVAGIAFSWSGYFVGQLSHLSIIGVSALFPWAIFCLEQAFARSGETPGVAGGMPLRRRVRFFSLFALIFGMQLIFAFPHTLYICCLVYAALGFFRLIWLADFSRPLSLQSQWKPLSGPAIAMTIAVLVGGLIGATGWLPIWELGQYSDRGDGLSFEWATQWKYRLKDVLTFLLPSFNGDVETYDYEQGRRFFVDNYGYAGVCTLLAAAAAVVLAIRKRFSRHHSGDVSGIAKNDFFFVFFWFATGLTALLFVFGNATPLYKLAFDYLPVFSSFRFPTRFMVIVALAIPLLGGIGITRLQAFLTRYRHSSIKLLTPALVGVFIAGVTWIDLVGNNSQLVPVIESTRWMKTPDNILTIQKHNDDGRILSPVARDVHVHMYSAARGWNGDLSLYSDHLEFVQPNTNLLYDLSAADAYSGISPWWAVDLIGDHNRIGMINELMALSASDAYFNWIEALSVRWYIFLRPLPYDRVEPVARNQNAFLHRIKNTLPRARFAQGVQLIADVETLKTRSISGAFDPRTEVAIHSREDFEAIPAISPAAKPDDQRVTLTVAKETEVVLETYNRNAGLLLLADTWYPGWKAVVDGKEQRILRVNLMHRGVVVPAGTHRVRFSYEPDWLKTSFILTLIGLIILAAALWFTQKPEKEI